MENKEAIELLKGVAVYADREFKNALNLAVVALEQQEKAFDEWCTDCKEYDHNRHCCPRFSKVIRGALDKVKRQRWIPVTERLPKKAGRYFVTARWNENMGYLVDALDYGFKVNEDWEGTDYIFPNGGAFGEDWNGEMDNLEKDILAWMPLPTPYREDEA